MTITAKQESYLLNLLNKRFGTSYGYLSQHKRNILSMGHKVPMRGINRAEASALIAELTEED